MNETVVKWFALGTVATVVMGALWLAASLQAQHGNATGQRHAGRPAVVDASQASILPSLRLAALPAEQAASSAKAARSQATVR